MYTLSVDVPIVACITKADEKLSQSQTSEQRYFLIYPSDKIPTRIPENIPEDHPHTLEEVVLPMVDDNSDNANDSDDKVTVKMYWKEP